MNMFARVVFPWLAPSENPLESRSAMRWWRVTCLLSLLPIAAVVHNVVLPGTRTTCMLNNLGAPDWRIDVIVDWLRRDPSLFIAAAFMALVYKLGLRSGTLRALVAPGFVSSILYSLWIWDIPFTGRVVCMTMHDNRLLLAEGWPVTSKLLLMASTALYLSALPSVLPRFKLFDAPAAAPKAGEAHAPASAAQSVAQPLAAANFSVETRNPRIG